MTFPQSSTVTRSFWSPNAKVDFSPMTFIHTDGYCRKGESWPHDPALQTNVGQVHGAPNNAFGDKLWFCFEEPRSVIGCMAECEARDFCGSFDRGTVPQSECCLFYKGNTGDGEAQRECFVKKTLPNELLPANHLSGTSVGVVPVPFIRYLKLTSNNEGLNADSQQGYCPFWTWCGFVVKDCFGGLLYDVVLQRTTDMDASGQEMLGTSVLAYVVKNAAGDILGRTAKLTDGSEPILIFNKDNQPVAVMVTPAGILMRALFDMTWYVNVLNPDIPVQQEPMTDPRLLTFIVTYQFRGLGFFGTFVTLLIFFLVLSVVCYLLYLRFYASAWLGPSSLRLWLSEWCGCCFPKRSQLLIDHEGYACCGGRGKPSKWSTEINSLTPIE